MFFQSQNFFCNIFKTINNFFQVNFLRLGQRSKVHPDILPYCDQVISESFEDPEQLRDLYDKAVSLK